MLARKEQKDSRNHDPSVIEASEVEANSKQNRHTPSAIMPSFPTALDSESLKILLSSSDVSGTRLWLQLIH